MKLENDNVIEMDMVELSVLKKLLESYSIFLEMFIVDEHDDDVVLEISDDCAESIKLLNRILDKIENTKMESFDEYCIQFSDEELSEIAGTVSRGHQMNSMFNVKDNRFVTIVEKFDDLLKDVKCDSRAMTEEY